MDDVRERDFRDKNRDIAPLIRSEDALYLDTTNMGLEAVVDRIIKEAQ